jgi:predicted protein tyrosine phosphatase
LFKNHPRYEARSAGTADGARIRVTAGHLRWSDLIFCMERKHADRLRTLFPAELAGRPIITLRIPDEFPFMAPELVARLRSGLSAHLSPDPGQS